MASQAEGRRARSRALTTTQRNCGGAAVPPISESNRVTTRQSLLDTVPMNDLARATGSSPRVACAAIRVLEPGRYVHGSEHDAFERELAEFVG